MFEGVMVATVTPFKGGKIDEGTYRRLIDYLIDNGVSGVVPCGTTGESATLSHGEHRQVTEIAIDAAKGRVPVVAGTGSNSTEEAVDLTLHARKAGADGALMVSPYYNKPSQEGIYRHFQTVAEKAAPLPIILYNIPGRTSSNMLPETIARLAEIDNIVGVKEASGDLMQMTRIIELCGPDFTVISGDDGLTLPLLAIGGKGVISVAAHLVPREMVEMVDSFLAGDAARACELHYRLLPIFRAIFLEGNPVSVKTALGMLGVIDPELRLPLCPMSEENKAKMKKIFIEYGLLK